MLLLKTKDFLRVLWTERRSILKEISPEYSLERLMLKLKLQYSDHLMWRTDSLEKTLMLGKIEGRRRRGRQRMRWLDGITDSVDKSAQALEVGDGQRSLACCNPWDHKQSDTTEQLNWTEKTAGLDRSNIQFWFFHLFSFQVSFLHQWTSLVAQMVKCLPPMQETQVQSLGQDLLEKEMASHSSTLAWKIPWTEEPCRLQSMGLQRIRHDWATSLHFCIDSCTYLVASLVV